MGDTYEPLQRYLRRRCAPSDVDDVLNDVLLVLWRRLDDVPDQRALPWAYGVARRQLANYRRSESRRFRLVGRASTMQPSEPAFAWVEESDADLHEALGRLDELDREVVRLWAWERLEPREIATVIGATPNAVTIRLSRIRRRLEQDISRQDRGRAGHKDDDDQTELTS